MSKKNNIEKQMFDGLLVNRLWLRNHGINSPLVDYYVRTGYFEAVARGIYRKPGHMLKWQHIIYSLQILGYKIHIGGRTALELHGFAHYLPLGKNQTIHIFCDKKLPGWIKKIHIKEKFEQHSCILFDNTTKDQGLTTIPFGSWDWPINIALPERAILEILAGVPKKESFHMINMIIEGAVNFRPNLVTVLLEGCKSIKVKRLFLWLSERSQHQWFTLINSKNVNLGSGKRLIKKNGRLDPKYLITVPKENFDGQEQSIF